MPLDYRHGGIKTVEKLFSSTLISTNLAQYEKLHARVVISGKGGIIVITVKILKIGTHKIITVTVLQLEQLDFTVQ